jgi:hypothetical protein
MARQPLVHIGRTVRNAVAFNLYNWDQPPMDIDSLLYSVERLFALLDERQIAYVLVGGIAMLGYVEGRNTEDIDLIMALSSLGRLPEIEVTGREEHFARAKFEDLRVDLLLADNPLFAAVQRDYAAVQQFAERPIVTATVEGLVLLKLYALPSLYRQGNFARVGLYENDIATLLYEYRPAVAPLLDELSPQLSESDMVEVRGILAEIEQRIERFRRGAAG